MRGRRGRVRLRTRGRRGSRGGDVAGTVPRGAGAASPFRPDVLAGRVALVTGGGTGIGRGISLALARHGADVVLASRERAHLEPAAGEIRALGRRALVCETDVRDAETVGRTVERTVGELGSLDVLVNNAAGNFLARAEELSEGGWRVVVDIVLTGTFLVSRAVHPVMRDAGGGSIVNVTTTYTDTGAPWMAHSGAAKAGVLNLTRSLATEWGAAGIRVNAVAPGLVEGTEGARRLVESPGLRDAFESGVPLGRLTAIDDVALAVLYLCSPAAAHVTGAEITVDGGASLGGRFADVGDRLPGGEGGGT